MAKTGQYDSALLGGILGLVVMEPGIGSWIRNTFESVIPSSWQIFGDWSTTVFAIGFFALLGFIFDKTR